MGLVVLLGGVLLGAGSADAGGLLGTFLDFSKPPDDEEHAEVHDVHDVHDVHGVHEVHDEEHGSRLSDEKIPLQVDGFPQRPKPLLELGEPFLGTGTLRPGFKLPTGAVWQPSLLAFGTFRTTVQSFEDDAAGRITEWANRLDLFFNLQLSGSERLVLGLRNLDKGGRFTSYFFEHPDPARDGELRDELDTDVETLFFEGDFGEIFPNLDRRDFGRTDLGFSLGRQPMIFQEGLLINDTLDGLGVTRNTLLPKGTSNFRTTFFYGWDNVDAGGVERAADLFAVLTSTDFPATTLDVDVAYVDAHDLGGDLLAAGVSAVQRIGRVDSSLYLLGSLAVDEETSLATDGLLLFGEVSWTPPYTEDHVYLTAFWALDEYTAAARGPDVGGPLGRAGINFAAVGLGSFTAPLSSRARDVAGGAVGYQRFFAHTRRQLLVEGGFRFGTDAAVDDAYAVTVRYQTALGRHLVVVTDGFVAHLRDAGRTPYGGRLELMVKF